MTRWLLTALVLSVIVPAAGQQARVAGALPLVPCAALTLYLRPGINPASFVPIASFRSAPDAPRGPFPVPLPLYPGVTPQKDLVGSPYASLSTDPYLETASSEYRSADSPGPVLDWYRAVLPSCGWQPGGYWSTTEGIFTTGHDFVSRSNPDLTVQVGVGTDPHGGSYLALAVQAIVLPPRPASSYLRGPFSQVRIAVDRGTPVRRGGSESPVWRAMHATVTDRAAIRRLVVAINSIRGRRTVFGVCVGAKAPLIGPVWLSFVRPNGSIVHAFESLGCGGELAVNGVRWLTDPGDVWSQVIRLSGGRG